MIYVAIATVALLYVFLVPTHHLAREAHDADVVTTAHDLVGLDRCRAILHVTALQPAQWRQPHP